MGTVGVEVADRGRDPACVSASFVAARHRTEVPPRIIRGLKDGTWLHFTVNTTSPSEQLTERIYI